MLIAIQRHECPPPLVVIAYDIPSPRRARRVRKALDPMLHEKQYSVYETFLGPGPFRGILAELTLHCDALEDSLISWRPRDSLRIVVENSTLRVTRAGANEQLELRDLAPAGNFIVCYDISEPASLRAIGAIIAPECAMLQRSVYWLRAPFSVLRKLFEQCSRHLDDGDKLWAYPLAGSHSLWHISSQSCGVLPIENSNWRSI
jgi:CRISPR/Cas system-associated endoribonuclease Cas2